MTKLIKATFLMIFLCFSAPGYALTIAEVGGVDTFIESATLANSGYQEEQNWIESVLGAGISLDTTYDSNASDWQLASDANNVDVYYLELASSSEYFLLKLGNGGVSLDTHYLYQNIGDLSYAVVDFLASGIDFSINGIDVGRVSHVGEIGTVIVPEPQSLFLFGAGLLALYVQRRKAHN